MIYNACCCGGGAARKTTLAELAEGSIIRLAEGDSLARFIVAKHDYESGLNGTGRTLVVRKDCYSEERWNSYSNGNAYASGNIDNWLNYVYKDLLSTIPKPAIEPVKIRYTIGNKNNTVSTLQREIFLLSATELGVTDPYINTEGSALKIASSLRIAYKNGSLCIQWTRSPYKRGDNSVVYFGTNGNIGTDTCSAEHGSRPAFTLPSTIDVNELGVII
nr:MAG TPA: hypothetical protein [Caudoviricetes sp.]